MLHHFLQNLCCHSRCDGLVAFLAIWGRQIRVKIPYDKDICAQGELANVYHDALQDGHVVKLKIALDDVPAAPSIFQMKADLTTFESCS